MPRRFERDPSHQIGRDVASGAPPDDKGRHAEKGAEKRGSAAQGNPSTEPRGERAGQHSSQGLAGAQGSGGGADRGISQPPRRAKTPRHDAAGDSIDDDNSGIDVA